MGNSTVDTLFLQNIERYVSGVCFICKGKCEDLGAFCHGSCAEAYLDDKRKRAKEAWDKAIKEYEGRKTIKDINGSKHD